MQLISQNSANYHSLLLKVYFVAVPLQTHVYYYMSHTKNDYHLKSKRIWLWMLKF